LDPATVSPDTRIEHAARLMLDRRFGSLPVVDAIALVGIVTSTDLLRAFVRVVEAATLDRITVELW
jgi:acetoin utilization protein AcuB